MSYQVLVYCEGRTLRDTMEPSHKGRRAHIARMEFVAAGEKRYAVPSGPLANEVHAADMWVPHPVSRRRYNKLRREGMEVDEPTIVRDISADGTVINMAAILSAPDSDLSALQGAHVKVELRCPLCRLDLQARMDTIAPYLDDLRRADWSEVTLTTLAAIVAK